MPVSVRKGEEALLKRILDAALVGMKKDTLEKFSKIYALHCRSTRQTEREAGLVLRTTS